MNISTTEAAAHVIKSHLGSNFYYFVGVVIVDFVSEGLQ